MKKRRYSICIVMMFLLVACSSEDVHEVEDVGTETETYMEKEQTETGNNVTEDIDTIEVYVESFECGYVSYADRLREGPLLITTKEELTEAEKYDCLNVLDEQWANNAIAETFEKLKENYPIEDYAYLIEYHETPCGGYYFHADKVGIIDDKIGFLLDEQDIPGPNEMMTEEMGGFCHMAAIPKVMIEGKTLTKDVY